MYVRYCAWLNAVPESPESEKPKKRESGKPRPVLSRREQMKKDGIDEPEMPACAADYLLGYLFEIGPTLPAGMGSGPLTHTEIVAWQANTGTALNSWEARSMRRLSQGYLTESHAATAMDRDPPWVDAPDIKPRQNRVAQSLKDSLKELKEL